MLTRMGEEVWATALKLFRVCWSWRSDKGLPRTRSRTGTTTQLREALHVFALHNVI